MNKIFIASDHGGLELKNPLIHHIVAPYTVEDLGTFTSDSVDYPDMADRLCKAVLDTPQSQGILICGTGIGISIRANRYQGIRAALVYSEFTAEMAKAHNNANVLCLGGRTTSVADAVRYVHKWLTTSFEGGRHQGRIEKLDQV